MVNPFRPVNQTNVTVVVCPSCRHTISVGPKVEYLDARVKRLVEDKAGAEIDSESMGNLALGSPARRGLASYVRNPFKRFNSIRNSGRVKKTKGAK